MIIADGRPNLHIDCVGHCHLHDWSSHAACHRRDMPAWRSNHNPSASVNLPTAYRHYSASSCITDKDVRVAARELFSKRSATFPELAHTRHGNITMRSDRRKASKNTECSQGQETPCQAQLQNITALWAFLIFLTLLRRMQDSGPRPCGFPCLIIAPIRNVCGTLELVRALSLLLEHPLIEGDLNRKAAEWRKNADEIVEQTHAGDYLARLERDYDLNARAQRIASNGMPACEELIREAESFLRGN